MTTEHPPRSTLTHPPRWTLVIHGGAGIINRGVLTPEQDAGARAGLHQVGRHVSASLPRRMSLRHRPSKPCGRNSVTAMNSTPRK